MKGENKKKIYIAIVVCGFICSGLMVVTLLYPTKSTSKKDEYHVMLTAYPYEDKEVYAAYNYGYETQETLFGESCEYVFYGKVIESELFRTNIKNEWNDLYAYALLKIRISNSIYGGLENGEEIYLVMTYSNEDDEKQRIQNGVEGLFIPKTPAVEVTFHDSQRKVEAVGRVGEVDYRFCSIEEYLPKLKKMNSLNEVREFWEEKRFCTMGGGS